MYGMKTAVFPSALIVIRREATRIEGCEIVVMAEWIQRDFEAGHVVLARPMEIARKVQERR